MMNIEAQGKSDVGRVRSENEDRYYCNSRLAVFAVADGIGGKPGGQVASQTVVDGVADRAAEIRRFIDARSPMTDENERDEIFDYLFEELQSINYEVNQRGSSPKFPQGIGCTTDLVVLVDGGAFILHVGDSRVYLIRHDEIFRVTRDHTFAEQLREEGRASQRAADLDRYAHVLTRSVGATPRVKVDRLFVDLEPGHRLVLCSDGITKYLSGADILRASLEDGDDLATQLVAMANEQGGADNSTVVVVNIGESDRERSFERHTTQLDTFRRVRFLQSIDLFEELELQEMLKILRYVYAMHCEAESQIIGRGEPVDGIYFVMGGKLSVDLGERHLGMLSAGDHFGEIGLFGSPIRSADVRSTEACDILFLPKDNLRELVSEEPVLGNKLLWRMLASTAEIVQDLL